MVPSVTYLPSVMAPAAVGADRGLVGLLFIFSIVVSDEPGKVPVGHVSSQPAGPYQHFKLRKAFPPIGVCSVM